MNEKIKINWYRTNVDKAVMSDLMRKSDARAFAQVIPQLALFAVTGMLAFLAYRNINATNWTWAVPLLLAALFAHGTCSCFFGGTACHELCHKTPFKTAFWNEFFTQVIEGGESGHNAVLDFFTKEMERPRALRGVPAGIREAIRARSRIFS